MSKAATIRNIAPNIAPTGRFELVPVPVLSLVEVAVPVAVVCSRGSPGAISPVVVGVPAVRLFHALFIAPPMVVKVVPVVVVAVGVLVDVSDVVGVVGSVVGTT